MSRTPETVIDKSAVAARNWLAGAGTFLGFLSVGAFGNANAGAGLILGGIAAVLIWSATQVKTRYEKTWEGGIYK